MGHHVLAVDYFSDDIDGLRASHRYPNNWLTMQTDIEHLDFRERSFDVVIVNHALQVTSDSVGYVERLKLLVRQGGLLILLGLSFYNDPSVKQQSIASFRQRHHDLHDFDIFFRPTKGYLDGNDRRALKERGVELYPYREPMLIARSLRAKIVRTRPSYGYGVWR
jgi:SAM-dependent methyltransferase